MSETRIRRWALVVAASLVGHALTAGVVAAQPRAHLMRTLDDVAHACEGGAGGRPRLHAVDVRGGVELRRTDAGVVVDTSRNLRALSGRVSLLVAGLTPIEFVVNEGAQVEALEAAAEQGALRLGFFIGFDDSRRQSCVLRGSHGVSTIRIDLAFAELWHRRRLIHRSETELFVAWSDSVGALAGEGPRAVVGNARFENGAAAPASWQSALGADAVSQRASQCHAEAVERGAVREAQLFVRLNVERDTGTIRRADVALSTVQDEVEARCLTRALGSGFRLPPGPRTWSAEYVDLLVPIHLAAED